MLQPLVLVDRVKVETLAVFDTGRITGVVDFPYDLSGRINQ